MEKLRKLPMIRTKHLFKDSSSRASRASRARDFGLVHHYELLLVKYVMVSFGSTNPILLARIFYIYLRHKIDGAKSKETYCQRLLCAANILSINRHRKMACLSVFCRIHFGENALDLCNLVPFSLFLLRTVRKFGTLHLYIIEISSIRTKRFTFSFLMRKDHLRFPKDIIWGFSRLERISGDQDLYIFPHLAILSPHLLPFIMTNALRFKSATSCLLITNQPKSSCICNRGRFIRATLNRITHVECGVKCLHHLYYTHAFGSWC